MEYSFDRLLDKYKTGNLSDTEAAALLKMIQSGHYDKQLGQAIDNDWDRPQADHADPESLQLIWQQILLKHEAPVVKMPFYRKGWVAAAALVVLVGTALWFFMSRDREPAPIAVENQIHDVEAPRETRAVITLADGRKVYLDSAGNGILARQDNVDVIRNEQGEIVYDAKPREANADLQYNILSNPRGSKVIALTLADGTRVWLNSESSLKYPTVFAGNTRKVVITGEAYFEVAQNVMANGAKQPFLVGASGVTTEVLGTHFNVNAFGDEPDVKITLLEGSVKVQTDGGAVVIKPGEQARATPNAQPQTTSSIDVEAVMAWKNGLFHFEKASLQDVMKQLTRWYDVNVMYEGSIPQREFVGEMERNLSLAQVLKILEKNQVHFRIENKTIVVMP